MNKSAWLTHCQTKFPKLSTDIETDIAIIGGGLTGCCCAYFLSNAPHMNITLLEADTIGFGASGRNTGKITYQHGAIYHKLIDIHNSEIAKLYYESQKEAILSYKEIIHKHNFQCDFQECSSLLYTNDDNSLNILKKEYQAGLDLGIPMLYRDCMDLPFPIKGAIECKHQAKFHPYKYLVELSKLLSHQNVSIYENSAVTNLKRNENHWIISCNQQKIVAKTVVICTQLPILDAYNFFYMKTYPEVSHFIASHAHNYNFQSILMQLEDPLSSTNITKENMFIHCGYKHLVGECNLPSYNTWQLSMQSHWKLKNIDYQWQTQDIMSYDHLPMIGPLYKEKPNAYTATAFSKWGNTNAMVAAKIIASNILNNSTRFDSVFRLHRTSAIFQKDFVWNNLHAAMQYLKAPQTKGDNCQIGEGKIVEINEKRYGIYRKSNDTYYIVDPICPHKHCLCTFNAIHKTWDCPCHGSIFSIDGSIIKGPSNAALPCKIVKLDK